MKNKLLKYKTKETPYYTTVIQFTLLYEVVNNLLDIYNCLKTTEII